MRQKAKVNSSFFRKSRALLQGASLGIFLLDKTRHIMFFNDLCEVFFQQMQADVLGLQCYYRSSITQSDRVESLTGALCPPPEVFEGAQRSSILPIALPDESIQVFQFDWYPSIAPDGTVSGVIGTVVRADQDFSVIEPQVVPREVLAHLEREMEVHHKGAPLIARSNPMVSVVEQIELAANSHVAVLIQGESGSGKSLIAQCIHEQSDLSESAIVSFDLETIQMDVLVDTLEHVLRSLADSAPVSDRVSSCQSITLLLKEITLLPRDVQSLILENRLKRFIPSGQSGSVRVLATTSLDPVHACSEGKLREDFLQFLRTLIIDVPPLRQREDDIELLAQHFIELQNGNSDHQVSALDKETRRLFLEYQWPGNVRELKETVLAAHGRSRQSLVAVSDLPLRFRAAMDAAYLEQGNPVELALDKHLSQAEIKLIQQALDITRGNKSRAAQMLGISRARLHRRMSQFGLLDR